MLNPDIVAALRSEIRLSPDLTVFRGRVIRRSELTTANPGATPSFSVSAEYLGHLTPPSRVFGAPANPACMQGIRAGEIRVPPKTLHIVPRARVIGNNFILGSSGEAYAPSPVIDAQSLERVLTRNANNHEGFAAEMVRERPCAYYVSRSSEMDFGKRALFLHNLEPGNYGSFLFRQLPQMLLLRDYPLDFDVYIVPDRTPWLREALKLVGLPPRPILTLHEVAGDLFTSIAFLGDIDAEGFLSEDIITRLHGLARTVWVAGSAVARRKIYISRRLSVLSRPDYRQLLNEPAIEAMFQRRGFSIVYPETLSFAEQISVFRQATAIAGPSGSGMLNAMFAEPGSKVLDMESFHYTVRQHAKIYSSSGKAYAFAFGALEQQNGSPPAHVASWTLEKEIIENAADWLVE